ncbi:MAG: antitoxin VapB family protein [Candidatus Kariarchaeaceae archaeon]|jgi:predicted CopG family antitoxin
MATKTVSITEDAYQQLKQLKLPGESFSQVILRLISRSQKGLSSLLDFIEDLPNDDVKKLQELADSVESVVMERSLGEWRSIDL